jgi:Ca-activated chloride channel family protein
MTFKDPLVLAAIPVVVAWFIWLRRKHADPSFLFPTDDTLRSLRWSAKAWAAGKMPYLRLTALVLLLIALARPQESIGIARQRSGIAEMLVIDCSSTMLAEDLQLGRYGLIEFFEENASSDKKRYNRIEAAKNTAKGFVRAGAGNMIGVVAFAAYAYVACPPTFDQQWVLSSIDRIRVGLIKDGTAIGSGILAGTNSLSTVKARSKVIVLLTDGNNNYGKIPPLVAARTAKSLGIRIYTVGIVSKGPVPYPAKDIEGRRTLAYVEIKIDEDVLSKISDMTGGRYYRVSSLSLLERSYADIDRLEKARLEQQLPEDARDIFHVFAAWALVALLADIVLGNTFLRRIP